jgi:hypothetical protein
MDRNMTRKEFLQYLGLFGLTAIGSGALLSSCSKKEEPAKTVTTTTKAQAPPPPATEMAADPCSDLTGLAPADIQMRETLKYVAKSTEPGKNCANCKFWQVPAAGAVCGGCQLIKGPINPEGHCTSWFTRES